MNNRNRHIQYRKSVYRRRRIRTVLITVAILLAVLLLAFFIIGNLLKKKTDERTPISGADSSPSTAEHVVLSDIRAYPVAIETRDHTIFAARIHALAQKGDYAAAIPLNRTDGTLLYRSPAAIGLGKQEEGAYSVTIESAMASVSEQSTYICGIFYLTAFSESNDLLRSVELAKEAAILTEAFRGGLQDILLIAPAMTAEHTDEILRFTDDLRAMCPDRSIGLALSAKLLTAEQASSAVDRLYDKFDYFALNAADHGDRDPVTYIQDTIYHTDIQYYRLRYHMRVLIPFSDDSSLQNTYIAALEENGIFNWMIPS